MANSLFDINGKVALITGSTHGLGMAMAKGLGQAGATIVVNGNSSQEKIDNAVAELKSEGINAVGYKFNVTEEQEVKAAVAKIESEVGPIDILINNAGIIKRIPLLDMEVSDFREVVDIDLKQSDYIRKHWPFLRDRRIDSYQPITKRYLDGD